jgi:HD superfamily phosphohydrolase
VADDRLVIDQKGIYSIENYLTSRRLMYWQVYLHKTTVAYEKMLVNTLLRAKQLCRNGHKLFASPALAYFLNNDVDAAWFNSHPESLEMYERLDDSDIWSAMKEWASSDDRVLALLASGLINRNIFKVSISEEKATEQQIEQLLDQLSKHFGVSKDDAHFLMSMDVIQKDMYDVNDDHIDILYKDGTLKDITEASEILNVQLLSKKISKYYHCWQRFS